MEQSITWKAFKGSLPALICYFPLGIAFGTIFCQLGFPSFFAPLFSLFVFAGAMQFLGVTLLAAGCPLPVVCLSIAPLGLRNILYGLTFLERYQKYPFWLRTYLAFGLVDATFSILHTGQRLEEEHDYPYCIGMTLWVHFHWVMGTIVGTFLNQWVTLPEGLDFAMTAFFAATCFEHLLKTKEMKPFYIASISALCALLIAPQSFFLFSVCMALAICFFLTSRQKRAV